MLCALCGSAVNRVRVGRDDSGARRDRVTEFLKPDLVEKGTATATFRVWRGDREGGRLVDYRTPVSPGMVVLDAIHQIQADQANDLAVRWNCKAGKCGSCSAEVNGNPRLMCMTRLSELPLDKPVTV